jgi:hypothetical protein
MRRQTGVCTIDRSPSAPVAKARAAGVVFLGKTVTTDFLT